jgi:DNA-binding transcriptional ArsR family regulator
MDKNQLEKILKALANRRRLAILAHLKTAGEMMVGDVARNMRLSFAATSRHLVILERSGILEKEQRDKEVFYRLASPSRAFLGVLFFEL